jgi:hypothetical protein
MFSTVPQYKALPCCENAGTHPTGDRAKLYRSPWWTIIAIDNTKFVRAASLRALCIDHLALAHLK